MVIPKYIEAETFEDFKSNQNKLIKILNHNMTKQGIDIAWLKTLNGWQIAILSGILIATICSPLF